MNPTNQIKPHLANAGGQLTGLEGRIEAAWSKFVPAVVKDLAATAIDVCFIPAPDNVIPQLGIGGYSPGPNNILVYLDPGFDRIDEAEILATLLHESHHCIRWRGPGYGRSLGQAMISEGLACLYEQEHLGRVPIYAAADLPADQVARAGREFDRRDYDRDAWFFGRGDLEFWFGYSLGYRICQQHSAKTGLSAAQLVDTPAEQILSQAVLADCAGRT